MTKYRLQFPVSTINGVQRKVINGPVLIGDVYTVDNSDKAVVTMNPVIATEGYLPVETFNKEDWNLSLNNGIIKDLIEQGIIIVEEEGSKSSKKAKKGSKKSGIEEVKVEDVSTPAEPVKIAEVSHVVTSVKSIFSTKSYVEKVAYVGKCADVAELKELIEKENIKGHLERVINQRIAKLSK